MPFPFYSMLFNNYERKPFVGIDRIEHKQNRTGQKNKHIVLIEMRTLRKDQPHSGQTTPRVMFFFNVAPPQSVKFNYGILWPLRI